MKVALIGASGYVGSRILAEALNRGHAVTAVVRDPAGMPDLDGVTVRQCDVRDVDALADIMAGHDAVISAFNPGRGRADPDIFDRHVAGHKAIIAAVKQAGVPRLLAVGGAASLKVPSGEEFLDSDQFPEEFEAFRDGIRGTRELYYLLMPETDFDWVFLAPSVRLEPGERTGTYRKGGDHVLYDQTGESRISLEDYAVAMIDELEHPRHHRERFTVGY